jgi:hypothetical protein
VPEVVSYEKNGKDAQGEDSSCMAVLRNNKKAKRHARKIKEEKPT